MSETLIVELTENENRVYQDINKLREDPSSFASNFSIVAKALDRIPSKKKVGKELDTFTNSLKNKAVLSGLKISPGLCKAAHDLLDTELRFHNYHDQLTNPELARELCKHVGGFKLIASIIDFGGVENMFARCMIADNDPSRSYRDIIFSPDAVYCGICSVEYDDEPATIIVFADNVTEGSSKHHYDPKDFQELKQAFDLFDSNSVGRINCGEIKKTMKEMGFESRFPVVCELIDKMDIPSELLDCDFNTFIDIIQATLHSQDKDGLYQIFRLFKDDIYSDSITLKNLKRMATELGEKTMLTEINELITLARGNENYSMSFEDFAKFYLTEEES